ncbi:protein ALTERED PHOSPHATE STARVATION RESPONSE 1-like [Trifolium pratense]|uniref:protein ALTERED PHOSPHATE STARVATION RESPONSE 1-like n=1 Tax=Trifolium pratense TaxID=57577 RepID=UPI001E6976FD|nr:protein ALTERED PHOSPHATE STARVATION RESPONSE 1-like [Trifolium pratense]XP_045818436.1 protein ALTERED PHOSPHATE STARVATION RESPONSE 1-like [Trifolium pratense]
MGCSQSKLNDEEAVKICKDRKRFIKEAVEHRIQFANGHIAYIQSLKRVSAALLDYFEGDQALQISLDSFIPISKDSTAPTTIEFGPNTMTLKVNYLRPSGNPPISVEEKPPSPETVRVESYSPIHRYGGDGFFGMQSSPMNASIFAYSPNNRPVIPPPSPQWDSFWNPFTSLDYYGYPNGSSLDQILMDDENQELRHAREEEGIPDLEQEEEGFFAKKNVAEEKTKIDANTSKEEVTVEDVDEEKEEKEVRTDAETKTAHEISDSQVDGSECFQVSKAQTSGHMESSHQEVAIDNQEAKEETPGFTVYVSQRPTNMAEVIRDLEAQFTVVCSAANDVSALLEAKKAQYSSTSNELSASKLLNPVALFRSASSRSSPSKIITNFSNNRDEVYDDPSDENCVFSVSHQSTLDRLYAWEKKLYQEVKSGTRVRLAYEKKCLQLRNHDIKGEEPSSVDKIRATIRDLHTQITVSIHSVEAISKRIETLRDEELHPQLLELVLGLAKMWKVMAECHQTQKQIIEEANILLAGSIDARKQSAVSITDPHQLARSVSNLETELRNWRNTFESWITSQRSYIHALTGWLLRCMRCEPDASKLVCSPRSSSCTHPLFGLCVQWSRRLDSVQETAVLDGIDSFAAGLGSFYAQQLREDSTQNAIVGNNGNMEMLEVGKVGEEVVEVAVKVLCGGMSNAMSSMAEFAIDYAKGYNELVKQWENVNLQQNCEAAK